MKMELGNRVDECNDESVNLTRVKHNLTLSQRNATNICAKLLSIAARGEQSRWFEQDNYRRELAELYELTRLLAQATE
ncbi:MAG: hypothetical protein WAO58_05125 [Fimbriimonadaceae bacterium]